MVERAVRIGREQRRARGRSRAADRPRVRAGADARRPSPARQGRGRTAPSRAAQRVADSGPIVADVEAGRDAVRRRGREAARRPAARRRRRPAARGTPRRRRRAGDERVGPIQQILRPPLLRPPAGEARTPRGRARARSSTQALTPRDERLGDRLRRRARSSPTRRAGRRDTACAASSHRARRSWGRAPPTAGPAPIAARDPSGTAGPAPGRSPARRTDRPRSSRRCAARPTDRARRGRARETGHRRACRTPAAAARRPAAAAGGSGRRHAGAARTPSRHISRGRLVRMAIKDALLAEFDHEMATTRRLLERLPDEQLSWKPHEKSMSLGGLARTWPTSRTGARRSSTTRRSTSRPRRRTWTANGSRAEILDGVRRRRSRPRARHGQDRRGATSRTGRSSAADRKCSRCRGSRRSGPSSSITSSTIAVS